MKAMRLTTLVAVVMLLGLLGGRAELNIVYENKGSDGVLAPDGNIVIDLSKADMGRWDALSSFPGVGVYDPDKWAVVFKYARVEIPSGVTVTFRRHPSNPPVVWLVDRDVTIAGTVSLNGEDGGSVGWRHTQGGPGGFEGGIGGESAVLPASSGFGWGGGIELASPSSAGSYATRGSGPRISGPTYGNVQVLPLIGGSGGAGRAITEQGNHTGGGGGGAILIAAGGTISMPGSGVIMANGGRGDDCCQGGGSGGAIRLVADQIAGGGILQAVGGQGSGYDGGNGRIRLEALSSEGSLQVMPETLIVPPTDPAILWPPDGAPIVRVMSVGGADAPVDPLGGLSPERVDIAFEADLSNVQIVVETENVHDSSAVYIRITPAHGTAAIVQAGFLEGDFEQSTWAAIVQLSANRVYAIQAQALRP